MVGYVIKRAKNDNSNQCNDDTQHGQYGEALILGERSHRASVLADTLRHSRKEGDRLQMKGNSSWNGKLAQLRC
jgi:hypothetical protein